MLAASAEGRVGGALILRFVAIGLLVYYAMARKVGMGGSVGYIGSGGSAGNPGSGASFAGVESRETVSETSTL